MADYSLADILSGLVGPAAGGGQAGGAYGTMTPQEAAAAVTPGSVLEALARRPAQLAAMPGQAYQGQPIKTPGQISDVDVARQLLSEGAINRAAPEAATYMIGAGGAPAEAAAMPDVAIGSGSRKLAAPAIVGNAPLFDYSRLHEVPDVRQFVIPRNVPARGVPEDFTSLTPEAIARANAAVEAGIKQGGLKWYNTMPLRDLYSEYLGGAEGPQRYHGYMSAVGATSPDTVVPLNIRIASYYDYLMRNRDELGNPLPLPPRIKNPETGNWMVPKGAIEPGYGARAQALHVQNMEALRDTGQLPFLQNPKPPSFVANLEGNYLPVTIDRHNLRLFGIPRSEPGGGYGYLEGLESAQAGRMGIQPAQYQSSGWLGGAEQTGVRSSNLPWLQEFENAIGTTADIKGLTPKQALRQFITGGMKLR